MTNESETIEQVFERCTSTDFSSRDREEILKAMQQYADLQVKEAKQTMLDYLHTNQNDCLDDGEYKAFEKIFEFIENLGKKLK